MIPIIFWEEVVAMVSNGGYYKYDVEENCPLLI